MTAVARRGCAGARVAVVLAAALGVAAVAAGGAAAARDPVGDLRVMSFNIRYGTADDGPDSWIHRRDSVARVIGDHRPDILGVQEALRFQLDALRERLPGYTEVGVGRDDGRTAGEYAAILVATARLAVEQQGTFWFSDTPDTPGSHTWGNRIPRICTWARLIDRTTQHGLWVFNVHLDHESQASRERSAALLLERIGGAAAGEPVIVTGDFNADETNPAILRLTGAPPDAPLSPPAATPVRLINTVRAMHPQAEHVHTFHAFGRRSDSGMIDYILTSPDIQVLAARILQDRVDGRYPSDHHAVLARLRL